MAGKPDSPDEETAQTSQLKSAIKDSAQQIWLAGLGAFAKAQAEGGKVFDALVKEGSTLQARSKSFTEDKFGEVGGRMSRAAFDVAKQASNSWDKLEQVFEDRVGRALKQLGVPARRDIDALMARIDQLEEAVNALGAKTARARPAASTRATAAPGRNRKPAKAAAAAQPGPRDTASAGVDRQSLRPTANGRSRVAASARKTTRPQRKPKV